MNTRMIWMDVVRGAAILLVVIFHSMTITVRFAPDAPSGLVVVNDFFAPFRMPMLMFLSGMLLSRSLNKPTRTFFAGKIRSIGWPYLLWSAACLAVTAQWTIQNLLRIVIVPPTYLWYLWFLLAYYVLAWGLNRIRVPFVYVAAVSLAASAFAPDDHRISRFLFLFTFFALGHWVSTTPSILRWIQNRSLVVGAVAISIAAAGGVISALYPDGVRYNALHAWTPLAAIALVLSLSSHIRPEGLGRPLAFIGRNSIVYYSTHFVLIWLTVWWLDKFGIDQFWLLYLLGALAAVGVGTVAAHGTQHSWVAALFTFPPTPWPAGSRRNQRPSPPLKTAGNLSRSPE